VFKDGSVYEGEVRGDKIEGKGKMMWGKDSKLFGDVYEGEFKNDFIEGKGIYKYSNGDVYEGVWKNNNKEGKGKYIWWKDGPSAEHIYEGGWKNGNRHGIGIYTYPNGRKEKREYEDDKLKRVIEVLEEGKV
jgi:hypothetical protein